MMANESQDQTHIIMKGKRMKRQRLHSPLALAMVSSSSCSSTVAQSDNSGALVMAAASPTTSVEFATSTEEEEDMANCLILLAQGNTKKFSTSSSHDLPATTATAAAAAAGLYVYQCKTCNRCFPSFQALGGHRASHKKPKVINNNIEANKKEFLIMEEENAGFSNMSTALSLQIANGAVDNLRAGAAANYNKANKVHDCSICGAEFSSGQALGGHMRRHRAFIPTTATKVTTTSRMGTSVDNQSPQAKKARNFLQLDLNLPAPEEDRLESKFAFASKEQVIVFSASPLVDCHY